MALCHFVQPGESKYKLYSIICYLLDHLLIRPCPMLQNFFNRLGTFSRHRPQFLVYTVLGSPIFDGLNDKREFIPAFKNCKVDINPIRKDRGCGKPQKWRSLFRFWVN